MEERVEELREVMKQLKEVWEREEKYWFQRSRIKWMKVKGWERRMVGGGGRYIWGI